MEQVKPVEQSLTEKVKPKKKKKLGTNSGDRGIRKESLNIIRTTYRNNIELTNIADNKANILLSLNALMVTFLIPIVLSNLDVIVQYALYLPIGTLSLTCLATIIMAAMATRPIKMGDQNLEDEHGTTQSPFFFGNYYKMEVNDYLNLLEGAMNDTSKIREYIKMDLYFMGKGLGKKYSRIRTCYHIFISGLIITIFATLVVLIA